MNLSDSFKNYPQPMPGPVASTRTEADGESRPAFENTAKAEKEPALAPTTMDLEFNGSILAILSDFDTADEFFADILAWSFTAFHPRAHFTDKWAWQFPNGRYVIFVCERHSVYRDGFCIYQNSKFTGAPNACYRGDLPAYTLLYKQSPSSHTYGIWKDNQNETFPLETAVREAAERSSRLQTTVAVVRIVDDYDMY